MGGRVYYGLEGFLEGIYSVIIYHGLMFLFLPICFIIQAVFVIKSLRKRIVNSIKASVSV